MSFIKWLRAFLRVPKVDELPPPSDTTARPSEGSKLLDDTRVEMSHRERVLRELEARANVISGHRSGQ